MPDQFIEKREITWGSRIKGALVGVLVGFALFIGSFHLLSWNEGRAIDRATTLSEAQKIMVMGDPAKIDAQNEGKLVYLSGLLDTAATLEDPTFKISEKALRLHRSVEMYQWEETHETRTTKTANGGESEETTYSYNKVWSKSSLPSNRFKVQTGHENPTSWPYQTQTFFASPVFIGPYSIEKDLASQLHNTTPYPLTEETYQRLDKNMRSQFQLVNLTYLMGDSQNPKIGDIRISFELLAPSTVSLLGKQTGALVGAYAMKKGSISLLEEGVVGPEMLIRHAEMENALITWGLRFLGFGMMWFGLYLFLRPLVVLGSFFPFLGDLLSFGASLIATIIALPASLVTIALAWLAVRPLLGGGLLGLAALLFLLGLFMRAKIKGAAPATNPFEPQSPTSPHKMS